MTNDEYELTIAATNEITIHEDLGLAFVAAAEATGLDLATIAEGGSWMHDVFLGGNEDDGSDAFTIRPVKSQAGRA